MDKIKYILSDMDGVLIDARDWHYDALNEALVECGYEPIEREDHLKNFDGLSTKQKLKKLVESGRIKLEDCEKIETIKQEKTAKIGGERISPIITHLEAFKKLRDDGYKICCCSNSIRATVELFLKQAQILPLLDFFLSNQDCRRKKPAPDIYVEAMKRFGAKPEECLILEDQENGLRAAKASGGYILKIDDILDVNYENIKNKINQIEEKQTINIVIPAAGAGSRFAKEGYKDPKPFIDVNGKPMIENVLENLKYPNARYIVITQQKYLENYISAVCDIKKKYNVEFVCVDGLTEGTVCSVLQARSLINNNVPLVIANSDQIVDIDFQKFIDDCLERQLDGSILTFLDEEQNPKWSFAKVDDKGYITEVKEKQVISNRATVGIYMWSKGKDFVNSSIDMIARNERVNNEFYTCPTYNYLIQEGKKIGFYDISFEQMHGIGTPNDLKKYLELTAEK